MNNYLIKYGSLVLILVFIQIIIFNNIFLFGYINPIIYVFFIFVFPIKKNKFFLLLFSFFLGLFIDFFSNSGGSNAAALVFVAYIRLYFLTLIQNKAEFDYLLFNIKKLNFIQIFIYVFSLTLLHHIIVFYLEYYTLKNISYILGKAFLTAIFSSILIGFSISLFVNDNNN